MKKIITLHTAKLAKEKGFDLASPAYYGCDDPASGESNRFMMKDWMKVSDLNKEDTQKGTLIYSAPFQSDLKDWLREIHNIHIIITQEERGEKWYYELRHNFKRVDIIYNNMSDFESDTFEQALERALQKALNQI